MILTIILTAGQFLEHGRQDDTGSRLLPLEYYHDAHSNFDAILIVFWGST